MMNQFDTPFPHWKMANNSSVEIPNGLVFLLFVGALDLELLDVR